MVDRVKTLAQLQSQDPNVPWTGDGGLFQRAADLLLELLNENRRLHEEVTQLREDLDQAVGYRLAVREQTRGETKGDQDRDV